MSQNSKIEWTDHTFNPWWGCTKVSPGCKYCYAETFAKRLGYSIWGGTKRRFFGYDHWDEPLRWQRKAEKTGKSTRVFCGSMCDVFEIGLRLLCNERDRLFQLIERTDKLIWMLLTKRPENILDLVPSHWKSGLPSNVWVGVTAENQECADQRMPLLLEVPVSIHFVSCEPLLGPISLIPWLPELNWVIVGGESGAKARPMHPNWARALRDQCLDFGVSYFFKRWGRFVPAFGKLPDDDIYYPSEECDKFVTDPFGDKTYMFPLSARYRGGAVVRLLDGHEWNQVPQVYHV